MPSDPQSRHEEYRNKLLGLGDTSLRKNYYPELRKRMRELEESRTRYKTIFNATADGLFIHDAETFEVIDINDRVVQMYGFTLEEIKNMDFNALCSGEEPYTSENAADYMRKTLTVGMQNFEWRSKRKDGSLFWNDIGLRNADIDGKRCIIASVRDISSRKFLEEQLVQSQKMEAMGQLAGGVAHDFNNMLTSIIGAAEIINYMETANDTVKKMSGVILKAADTAENLTKQLLSFSRKGTFELSQISIHKALRNAAEILPQSFSRDIELVLDLHAANDIVLGNLSLIENIIINLSLNARDAMLEGGKLTIYTDNRSVEDSKFSGLSPQLQGGCLCLVVSDTGRGMREEDKPHIFEPFFTTKEVGKGTGLGLAAVYGAVQRHNGIIEVESIVGEGTSFIIYLPSFSE